MCRMLGASGCEIGADAACRQGRQVRFAAVTGVGGGFFGLAAEIVFGGLDQRHESILVTHVCCQVVCDNDLCRGIDGGLCVVALDVAVLGQQNAAVGVSEVALCLAVGLRVGRRRGGAVFLASLSETLRVGRGLPLGFFFGGGFGFGLQCGLGGAQLHQPLLFVGYPGGHFIAALVAVALVLFRIGGGRRFQPAIDLARQLDLPLLHALIAHRFVLGGVCPDLGAVERNVAELHQPRLLGQTQPLLRSGAQSQRG